MKAKLVFAGARGALVGAVVAAATLAFAGVVAGRFVMTTTMDAVVAGLVTGGLLLGPVIGAAIATAQAGARSDTGDTVLPRLNRGAGFGGVAGAVAGTAGAVALWAIHTRVNVDQPADPVAVALGGLLVGWVLGSVCGWAAYRAPAAAGDLVESTSHL